MTESKRKTTTKSEIEEEETPSPQATGGDESGETESGEGQELGGPAHEQGYTEETAKRNAADFGQPVPEVGLEGRGTPGVS